MHPLQLADLERTRELRVTAEAAYEAWEIEAPMWRYNQAVASSKPATEEVTPQPSKEILKLRQIRQFVESIAS